MKIIVVDDEQDVELLFRQRFRRELRSGQIEFEFALSGSDALDRVSESDLPDLVLSDVNMPGMTGIELLKELKEHYPELEVMMITAYGDEDYYRAAIDGGASDFFVKPLDFKLLKDRLAGPV